MAGPEDTESTQKVTDRDAHITAHVITLSRIGTKCVAGHKGEARLQQTAIIAYQIRIIFSRPT